MDDEMLFDMPDDIYADDIATAHSLGDTFRTVFFAWVMMPGDTILHRKAVACIVRPRRSLERGKLSRLLAAQRQAPKEMRLHS